VSTLTPLTKSNAAWLRYLYRKAITDDSWERDGHPADHWDNLSEPPMLCYHRFDLIDSTYAVALMADRTPAWREVYEQILDELIFRHTGWWAAEDWLTQIGDDPKRANYPEDYRPLIPAAYWGNYNVPGWTANGIEPWGLQWDPIGADGNLFFKGFFLVMLGLHRRVTGNTRWDAPFDMVRDGEHTFSWWHSKIAEHLAAQWRAHPEGCHCENTKIWPYCLAGAGFGLQLADQAFGSNHHQAFDSWWAYARHEYLHIDAEEPPAMVTFYYDPIIDEHLEVPAAVGGAIPVIYLAPQVPEDARRLWDIARAQMGMLVIEGPVPVIGPRFTALALLLARNWAVTDFADALESACAEQYPPTWDEERGEVTWDFGLGEPHPRGQYNATMAAADAMTEGGWWRLGNTSSQARFAEPTVGDVDFPTVALTRADWDRGARQLNLTLDPISNNAIGRQTQMRVSGLDDPTLYGASSPDGAPVEIETQGADLVLRTPIGRHALVVKRN
jgi:hypothetical protein